MNTQLQDSLEKLIDCESLAIVLEALSAVCYEKASHLESNWQDAKSAKHWEKAGNAIARVADSSIVCAC